ncbi:MAG: glycosyltransferase [Patescibacteria group bacterium]
MKRGIVSIVIPTKNSTAFLENTLKSIKAQSYPYIETIVVDGNSTDNTVLLAKKYNATIMIYAPKVQKGIFDAPHKRNYGMARGKGEYVYWLDADMELPKNLIKEAVALTKKGYDGIIFSEDSFGEGIWANAKQLERRCYWGDLTVESPRFFTKKAWDDIGGFDLSLGAGGDDIDLTQKLMEKGYKIQWTENIIRHNEGKLSITKLFKKRFMYGREMVNYLKKRPKSWIASYNPIKFAYFRHWKLLLAHPVNTVLFIVMRLIEYTGGFSGLIYSYITK